MHTADLIRWAAVSGLAAALLRWPSPGSPFWSFGPRRPLVLARVAPSRFRQAAR